MCCRKNNDKKRERRGPCQRYLSHESCVVWSTVDRPTRPTRLRIFVGQMSNCSLSTLRLHDFYSRVETYCSCYWQKKSRKNQPGPPAAPPEHKNTRFANESGHFSLVALLNPSSDSPSTSSSIGHTIQTTSHHLYEIMQ